MAESPSLTRNSSVILHELTTVMQRLMQPRTQTIDCVLPFTGTVISHDAKTFTVDNNKFVFKQNISQANVSYSTYGAHVSQAINAQSKLSLSASSSWVFSDNYPRHAFPYTVSPSWRGLGCFTQNVALYSSQSALFKRTLSAFKIPLDSSLWFYTGQLDTSWQGDYTVRDKQGAGGFFQGRFLTAIQGGKFCSTIWSSVDQKLIEQYLCSQRLSPTTLQMYRNQEQLYLLSYTPTQALGITVSNVEPIQEQIQVGFDKDAGKLQYERLAYSDTQKVSSGLYRFQQITSPVLHGRNTIVVTPDSTVDVIQKSDDIKAIYHEQISTDGAFVQKSINNIATIKSPYIQTFGYFQKQQNLLDKKIPEEVPLQERLTQLQEAQVVQLDVPLLQAQMRLPPQYAQKYKPIQMESKTAPVCAPQLGAQHEPFKLDTNQTAYDPAEPQEVYINQQTSSLMHGTTSIIHQLPDGSVIIKDGYGSQIRMVRGNIIISSALDIILRPGRHLRGTVPGDMSLSAQNMDIVGRDTVDVISDQHIKMDSDAIGISGKRAAFIKGKQLRATADKIIVDHQKNSAGVKLCFNGGESDSLITARKFDLLTTGGFSCFTKKMDTLFGVMCTTEMQVATPSLTVSCNAIRCQPTSAVVEYSGLADSFWSPQDRAVVSVEGLSGQTLALYSAETNSIVAQNLVCQNLSAFRSIQCKETIVANNLASFSEVSRTNQIPLTEYAFSDYQLDSAVVLPVTVSIPDLTSWQSYVSTWRVRLPQSKDYGIVSPDKFYLTQISWQADGKETLQEFKYQIDGKYYYEYPGQLGWRQGTLLSLVVPDTQPGNRLKARYKVQKANLLQTAYKTNYKAKKKGH